MNRRSNCVIIFQSRCQTHLPLARAHILNYIDSSSIDDTQLQ